MILFHLLQVSLSLQRGIEPFTACLDYSRTLHDRNRPMKCTDSLGLGRDETKLANAPFSPTAKLTNTCVASTKTTLHPFLHHVLSTRVLRTAHCRCLHDLLGILSSLDGQCFVCRMGPRCPCMTLSLGPSPFDGQTNLGLVDPLCCR